MGYQKACGPLTLADVGGIQELVEGPVESRPTLVAVDALRVVLAVAADAAAVVDAVHVQALLPFVHLLVVVAIVRVAEAVAGCRESKPTG